MDPDEILELVKDGTIEPDPIAEQVRYEASQIEDFENLDPDIQELVANGDLDIDEVM